MVKGIAVCDAMAPADDGPAGVLEFDGKNIVAPGIENSGLEWNAAGLENVLPVELGEQTDPELDRAPKPVQKDIGLKCRST